MAFTTKINVFALFIGLLSPAGLLAQNVGIGTATPAEKLHVAGDIRVDNLAGTGTRSVFTDVDGKITLSAGTGAASLPVGTTAQRPGTPATGYTRYNTDLAAMEYYNGATWVTLTSAGLADGRILVGNASNVATAVTMSGDVAIDNAGAATIQDNSVDGTDIALGGDALGDLMYYDGTNWVRLATGTAGYKLQTNGAGAPSWVVAPGGSGTLNYVPKWTPNANTLGNSQLYDNGTNVGLGTTTFTSATDKLDIRNGRLAVNEIAFRNTDGTDDSDPYRLRKMQSGANANWLELQLNDDDTEEFRIYGNSCVGYGCAEYSGNLEHYFRANGYAYHAGYLGIGTTTPATWLEIQTGAGSDYLQYGGNLSVYNAETTTGEVRLGSAFNRAGIYSGSVMNILSANEVVLGAGGNTTHVTLSTNGNVGIGIVSGGRKLDVAGNQRIRLAGDMGVANNSQLEISNAGSGNAFISFHNEGSWGAHLGLEGSWLTTRGWSAGAGYTNLRVGLLEYGNGQQNTFTRDNAGLRGDAGARSGFHETSAPSNYPAGAGSWWHMIDCRHSNAGNNYAMQISGSFFDQNIYYRKTNDNAAQAWSKFETSNDLPRVRFYPRNGTVEGSFRAQINGGVLQFEQYNEGGGMVWNDYGVLGLGGLTQAIITYSVINDDTNGGCNIVSRQYSLGTVNNGGGWVSGTTDMGCGGSDGNTMMIQIVYR